MKTRKEVAEQLTKLQTERLHLEIKLSDGESPYNPPFNYLEISNAEGQLGTLNTEIAVLYWVLEE